MCCWGSVGMCIIHCKYICLVAGTNIKCACVSVRVCCTPACRAVDSRALCSVHSFCSSLSGGCRSRRLLWDTHCQVRTLTFLHTQEKPIHSEDKHTTVSVTALKQCALPKSSMWTGGGTKRGSFHLKQEHSCFWEFSRGRNVPWLNLKVW